MTTPQQPPSPIPGGWTPPPQQQYGPGAPYGAPPMQVRLVPAAPNGAPLADFWYRLGAYMLDGLIVGAISMVVAIPALIIWMIYFFQEFEANANTYGSTYDPAMPFASIWIFLLIELAIIGVVMIFSYLYFVEYQLRKGQTVGKRVLKIKIVPADPAVTVLTRSDLAKRWAVSQVVGTIVPFFSYLDGLWQLWDKPLQQCLHDKAAKTVVIRIG
ncbi:putative RDD family membrane protein YckC [Allocatelliglobosispora scoriae]|uniref:Putative RDD family membrane protein YckC n=1 Tax=Allocatelliglobosispora scoriae TaxID=643052 RepID=A0A841C406_9ACTN|nr:RDD family protein [Allocatelliglobosispora scoriae]MBB5873792.1 putative RDD family membrane protein YckC [Allocatelliglobosispora scoriae]